MVGVNNEMTIQYKEFFKFCAKRVDILEIQSDTLSKSDAISKIVEMAIFPLLWVQHCYIIDQ